MKLFSKDEALGRKFVGFILTLMFLFIGAVLFKKLDTFDAYDIYAKWAVIAFGVFSGANFGITALLGKNKDGGLK